MPVPSWLDGDYKALECKNYTPNNLKQVNADGCKLVTTDNCEHAANLQPRFAHCFIMLRDLLTFRATMRETPFP